MAGQQESIIVSSSSNDHRQLHDGAAAVQRVVVLSLVKDNAGWLRYALPRLEAMEALYPSTRFAFYFYENDSKDDTVPLLRAFLAGGAAGGRTGQLFSEPRQRPYVNKGINFDRTNSIAQMRNRLLELVGPHALQEADWCLMLDSNIFFAPTALGQMFEEAKPAADGIVMVTPYSSEVIPAKKLRAQGHALAPQVDTVGLNHYYDTFALVDGEGRCFWPRCPFEQCRMCSQAGPREHVVPASTRLLDVRAAFGGFALVQARALLNPMVRWSTVDFAGHMSLCEHVGFCQALRVATGGGRVVVATRVNNIHWIGG